MDEAQTSSSGAQEPRVWWGNVVWHMRASVLVFALSAAALTLPAQITDMLANLADSTDSSLESWWHAIGFHGAMILMAVGLWYWARAVLLAWFRVPDTAQGRASIAKPAGSETNSSLFAQERARAARAFDFLPRAMCLGTAVVAGIATARSDKWLQTALVVAWGLGLYYLLKHRLALQARFGLAQTGDRGPRRPPGRGWLGHLWQRLLELLDYAPLGRWIAAWSLALASGLFVLSALTAFVHNSIAWKTYLAHLLPGPSIALFLLGMSVAPLTAITYCVDRTTRRFTVRGMEIQLRYVPVLLLMLILMGVGATIMNLHALRIADTGPRMAMQDRASLGVLFQAWAEKCAPGDGPVQPILVAVSGGASRAGLWAARVLDVVDDGVRKSGAKNASVFAVSSVSGGSLGAAAYVAMRAGLSEHRAADAPVSCMLPPVNSDRRDVAEIEALRADAIGPALAGMLLGDAPRALAAYAVWPVVKIVNALRPPNGDGDQIALLRGNDRAEALERAFEYNWQANGIKSISEVQAAPFGFEQPYLSLFYKNNAPRGDVPLWITNGTDVNTGDRLITVPFDVNGERFCQDSGNWYALSAADAGCGRNRASYFWPVHGPFLSARDVLSILKSDIPISTAVDNTSRFPFLSPSGELTPTKKPRPEEAAPNDAQIIDGGYFENEGIMSAMEIARWLRTYGPGLLHGRAVYPIVVQATSDADSGKSERDIARCGNRLPLNPGVADATARSSQFLVPLIGLTAVRSGHSRSLLQQALEDFCDEGGQQAFFHFYLYNAPDFDVPLNWSLSERVADFIWDDKTGAFSMCGNIADRMNLEATLRLGPDAWKPRSQRPRYGDRDLYSCAGKPLKVTKVKLPNLAQLTQGSD